MQPLRLSAFDADDLAVISAHMQDAIILMGDVRFVKREHRFALVASRFVWDNQETAERRRTGLHFEGILSVRSHRIIQGDDQAVLSLLRMAFEPGEAPGGTVVLEFSGGGIMRLEAEFLECWLRDLGAAWEAASRPGHDR